MARKKRVEKADLPIVVATLNYDPPGNRLLSPAYLSGVSDSPEATMSPPRREFEVLWDTGASASAIDKRTATKLALKPVDRVDEVYHADGVKRGVNVYAVNFSLGPDQPGINIMATEATLSDCDMLVGMDVITSGDFVVTRHDGRVRMTFRVPPMGHFDFVAEFDKEVARLGGGDDIYSRNERRQSRPHKP